MRRLRVEYPMEKPKSMTIKAKLERGLNSSHRRNQEFQELMALVLPGSAWKMPSNSSETQNNSEANGS